MAARTIQDVNTGLAAAELELIRATLRRHPEVTGAILFGSRAKGCSLASSDIDLALEGLDDPLRAESVASELDELSLPYKFDVLALGAIHSEALLEHIRRVGVQLLV